MKPSELNYNESRKIVLMRTAIAAAHLGLSGYQYPSISDALRCRDGRWLVRRGMATLKGRTLRAVI